MIVLLPPSETKVSGGVGMPADFSRWALPRLQEVRERVTTALIALAHDEDAAARALKLGPRQRGDVQLNRELRSAPTMPAIERYTGVLFDALSVSSLERNARAWIDEHVLVHTAPFGPVGAGDEIPSYRLAAGHRLPGSPTLRALWSVPVADALARDTDEWMLDLRSDAYAQLGPAPADRHAVVRVVTHDSGGATRALNHFNKAAKGRLVRALAMTEAHISCADDVVAWGAAEGFAFEPVDGSVLRLVV